MLRNDIQADTQIIFHWSILLNTKNPEQKMTFMLETLRWIKKEEEKKATAMTAESS